MFSSFLSGYSSSHQQVKEGHTADRLFLLGLLCIQDEVSESGRSQASVGHGSKAVLLRESFEGVGPWYTSQVSRTADFQQACRQNGVSRGASFLGLVLSVQGETWTAVLLEGMSVKYGDCLACSA